MITLDVKPPPSVSYDLSLKLKQFGEIVKVGWISPLELRVAPTNCRVTEIPDIDKQEMDDSIRNSGVISPVVINENKQLVKGQLRWGSALRTGEEWIPFIQMKFTEPASELAVCLIEDSLFHPLTEDDRYSLVMKAFDLGKDYEYLVMVTGKDIATIRGWVNCKSIPEVVKKNPDLQKKFSELPSKKKTAVNTILKRAPYVGNDEKSLEVINLALESPSKDLEDVRKLSMDNVPVDAVKRLKRVKSGSAVLRIKISSDLCRRFNSKVKEENRDPNDVIEELITEYVNDE